MRLISTNLALSATVTVSSESGYFPKSNLNNYLRSKRFRTTSKATQWVVFDLGSAVEVDSFIMLLPLEGTINMTESATIKLQANASNSWGAPSVDVTLTLSAVKKQLSHFFSSAQSYRYWRVTVDDSTAVNNYVEISKIILGKADALPVIENGFSFDHVDGTKILTNDYGTSYADKYPFKKQLDFNYRNLYVNEIQVIKNMYLKNGISIPVYIVLDETSAVFNKEDYSIYGRFTNKFGENHKIYTIFDLDKFNVVEVN